MCWIHVERLEYWIEWNYDINRNKQNEPFRFLRKGFFVQRKRCKNHFLKRNAM